MPVPGWPDFDHWFPPVDAPERRPAPAFNLRNPAQEEHARLLDLLADWLERPALPHALGGMLLRQMDRVSWLAETDSGRTIGLLLGLVGPDRPGEAAVALVGVDPALRRRGIGRALVERFGADVGERGAARIVAAVQPDERIALAFFAALGFEPDAGPGATHIHGIPAFADWDGPGQDRAVLVRSTGRA
jgi:ribosomal protein S18 acetylase RimI-like enzyme